MPRQTIIATDETIKKIVEEEITKHGDTADLNHIDVSRVTDMSELFSNWIFNGDISRWDVSNVTNMSYMFFHSPFHGDISKWNVSKVTDMCSMFSNSGFNSNIAQWNVSNVKQMNYMFDNSAFNGDISKWNVTNVTDMDYMFNKSIFDGDISKWNVSKVISMNAMFANSDFKSDISHWNVSSVTDMASMFDGSSFNGNLSTWLLHADCRVIDMMLEIKNYIVPPFLRVDSIATYEEKLEAMHGNVDWKTTIPNSTGGITKNHGAYLLLLPDKEPATIHPELTQEDADTLQMLYQLTGSVYQSVIAWEQQRHTTTLTSREFIPCL